MQKQPAVYIMTNKRDGVLYVGVTSDLPKRTYEHKHVSSGFVQKYNCHSLVYYELLSDMESAIMREKQLKAGSRRSKLALINAFNSAWNDLYENILG